MYWANKDTIASPVTMYAGELVCMEPGDYAALAAAGHEQGDHAFKVQYGDCTAEVLDLVSLKKVGCPCTELCTVQNNCSRAAPAKHHRMKWVLAKHDTEANRQLLLAMDSEAHQSPPKRKRQAKTTGRNRPRRAPQPAANPTEGSSSSSDDDVPLGEAFKCPGCKPAK